MKTALTLALSQMSGEEYCAAEDYGLGLHLDELNSCSWNKSQNMDGTYMYKLKLFDRVSTAPEVENNNEESQSINIIALYTVLNL